MGKGKGQPNVTQHSPILQSVEVTGGYSKRFGGCRQATWRPLDEDVAARGNTSGRIL